jgi:hypothetical protein
LLRTALVPAATAACASIVLGVELQAAALHCSQQRYHRVDLFIVVADRVLEVLVKFACAGGFTAII